MSLQSVAWHLAEGTSQSASPLPLQITVTAHPASSIPTFSELEQEWRVLRFNDTRQSVSRVLLSPNWLVPHADAACLAFEYLKTMASAGQAALSITSTLLYDPSLLTVICRCCGKPAVT